MVAHPMVPPERVEVRRETLPALFRVGALIIAQDVQQTLLPAGNVLVREQLREVLIHYGQLIPDGQIDDQDILAGAGQYPGHVRECEGTSDSRLTSMEADDLRLGHRRVRLVLI
ncbi:hypothetical protein [Actinomadura spongiicola]|uniref:hypothetical protein n=1 Tax=Actinomadura spongiicola TaxID=2303421 RepID=UPI0011C0CA8C|nr:hypothetical protein [Actinomadura spongiicola]